VEQDETKNIILSAEDYLLGVIGMVNELVSRGLSILSEYQIQRSKES